jgi:hypothetical protein
VVAGVAGPSVEERRLCGCPCSCAHAEDEKNGRVFVLKLESKEIMKGGEYDADLREAVGLRPPIWRSAAS